MFKNISNSLSSFQQNRNLVQENEELREEIHKIRTRDFIQRKDTEESLQIVNFQETLFDSLVLRISFFIFFYIFSSFCKENYFIFRIFQIVLL